MKNMSNNKGKEIKKNSKMIRVPEAEYLVMRRDQKVKREFKSIVLILMDKVKNWK